MQTEPVRLQLYMARCGVASRRKSEELIQHSMETLCRGRSTLVIAHRLSTVRKADYTYVLRKGRVVEHGPHDALIERHGYYFDLYNRHVL